MEIMAPQKTSVPGYKRTEIGVIPSDWDVKELGTIGQCFVGLTYRPTDVSSDGVLVLRASNVQHDSLEFYDNVFVDVAVPERTLVHKNDILICVRNGSRDLIGKCALIDDRAEGMAFGAFMAVFRTSDYGYVLQQFRSEIIKRQIHANLGATINQITNKSLASFRIPWPREQRERKLIAGALTNVDELISSLDQLIGKMRYLKRAAMQQLLNGKTRLPGFSGKWEMKQLGDIAKLYQPQTISQAVLKDDGYLVYGANGIIGKYDRYNHESWQTIITCRGSTCGTVSKTEDKVWITGNAMVVNCDNNKYVDKLFLFHLLSFQDFSVCITGSGQPQIVRGPLSEYSLCFPPSVDEQRAIASVLSDVDTEITALEQRRDKTVALKQGMMQELLTGKIRLL